MLITFTILAELIFVSGLIIWFYRLKPRFGLGPLFVFIGSNQFFQTILATTFYVKIFGVYTISPGSTILFCSGLFTVLLIYIKEGVFITQRLILGIIFANLTFTLFAWLTNEQSMAMKGADLVVSEPSYLFKTNSRVFIIGTIVLLLDTLIIVILYEYFFVKQKWLTLYTRLLLTMLLVMNFDAVVFTVGCFWDKPGLENRLVGQLIAKSIVAVFFATILWIYLRYLDRDKKGAKQKTSYGKEDIFSILTYRSRYEKLITEKAISEEHLQQAIAAKTKVLEQEIITRKQVQQEIIYEKELSDSLINSLPGVFYLYNEQGKFFRWNKNFEIVTGYNSDEMTNKHPLDFFEGEDSKILENKIKNVFEVGEDNVSANFVDRWGNKTPYFFTGKMIIYEEERSLMGVGIDISDRVKMEDNLIKSEQSLRQVLSSITDIFYVINKNYQITLMNKIAKELLSKAWGKSVEVGKNILEIIPQNSNEPIEDSFEKVFSGESVEYEHFHSTEQMEGWFLVNYHPVINEDEQIIGAYIVTKDITEIKNAEAKIVSYNKQLQELTTHLLSVREEERLRIGREIHDDLGQQLTAIKMDVAWIDKKTADENPVKTKLKNIIGLLDGSNQSVRRILNELKPAILDEYGLLDALEWHIKQFISSTGIPAIIETKESEIRLDEELAICIFRVCQEALTNVARHSGAKNVLISIVIANEQITVKIEDNGKGFKVKEAQNKGSFGLIGMNERARSLNGNFEIESTIGKGTIITISLPYRKGNLNKEHE